MTTTHACVPVEGLHPSTTHDSPPLSPLSREDADASATPKAGVRRPDAATATPDASEPQAAELRPRTPRTPRLTAVPPKPEASKQPIEQPVVFTEAEAERLAALEGIQLIRAPGTRTGFRGVTQSRVALSRPFEARFKRKGQEANLGSFGTAAEAALAYVRHACSQGIVLPVVKPAQLSRNESVTSTSSSTAATTLGATSGSDTEPTQDNGGPVRSQRRVAAAKAASAARGHPKSGDSDAPEASPPRDLPEDADVESDHPMGEDDAVRVAADEGLRLATAPGTVTGYKCVTYKPDRSKPYDVRVKTNGHKKHLGSFHSAAEAALYYARHRDEYAGHETSLASESEFLPLPTEGLSTASGTKRSSASLTTTAEAETDDADDGRATRSSRRGAGDKPRGDAVGTASARRAWKDAGGMSTSDAVPASWASHRARHDDGGGGGRAAGGAIGGRRGRAAVQRASEDKAADGKPPPRVVRKRGGDELPRVEAKRGKRGKRASGGGGGDGDGEVAPSTASSSGEESDSAEESGDDASEAAGRKGGPSLLEGLFAHKPVPLGPNHQVDDDAIPRFPPLRGVPGPEGPPPRCRCGEAAQWERRRWRCGVRLPDQPRRLPARPGRETEPPESDERGCELKLAEGDAIEPVERAEPELIGAASLEAEAAAQTAALLTAAAHGPISQTAYVMPCGADLGLFARQALQPGQLVGEYGGPRMPSRMLRHASFALHVPSTDVFIDGNYDNSPFDDGFRSPAIFANHASEGNARLERWPVRSSVTDLRQSMCLVASEPIEAGAEIRWDYESVGLHTGGHDSSPPSEDAAWRAVRLPTLPPSGAERIIDRLAVLQAATIKGDAPPPLPEPDYLGEGPIVCARTCEVQRHSGAAAWQAPLPWDGPSGGDARMAHLATIFEVSGEGSRGWANIASHLPGRSGRDCRERWLQMTRQESPPQPPAGAPAAPRIGRDVARGMRPGTGLGHHGESVASSSYRGLRRGARGSREREGGAAGGGGEQPPGGAGASGGGGGVAIVEVTMMGNGARDKLSAIIVGIITYALWK